MADTNEKHAEEMEGEALAKVMIPDPTQDSSENPGAPKDLHEPECSLPTVHLQEIVNKPHKKVGHMR